ncbi:MAG: hypothetical protein ACYC5O_20165 [Anaerolineae bacterium]
MPTLVSFFLDDVAPYALDSTGSGPAPVDGGALTDFLEFVRDERLAGALSVIPAMFGLLSRATKPHERRFASVLANLGGFPVDAQMEIMTHGSLFDFDRMAERDDGSTERDWLDDLAVSADEYREYIGHTIAAGRELGVRYAGMTTPGTHPEMNPNVWQALLALAEAGELSGHSLAVFANVEPQPPTIAARLMAHRGDSWVYDLPSATEDFLACWLNRPDVVDVAYYVRDDGLGRMDALIAADSPTAVFHMHWQGVNPQHGHGWRPLQEMVRRLNSRYGDRIVWATPSAIATLAGQASPA